MPTIHWLGTGLSALPGLKRLILNGHRVYVYNRSMNKAIDALTGMDGDFKLFPFSLDNLPMALSKGDIVVSMLPGEFHQPLAEISLASKAHFVSSSYISDGMQSLHKQAIEKGLCLVNEVGLDPGIDHSMAHALVSDYKQSNQFDKNNQHSFLSYCGGLSEVANDFCYKFSWSPLGVLKALKSPSVSIRNHAVYKVQKPWESVQNYMLAMPWGEEEFEVYPNRDSRPFIQQYHLNEDWDIKQFVRGTLRYKGWKSAWASIFSSIDSLSPEESEPFLKQLSEELWQKYAFTTDESDRVVLSVELMAETNGNTVWHKSYILDAIGNSDSSAMARLVSIPVSLAVEAVLQNEIPPGVSAAPDQSELVTRWLRTAENISDNFAFLDHMK